jgi:translation initiation factor 1
VESFAYSTLPVGRRHPGSRAKGAKGAKGPPKRPIHGIMAPMAARIVYSTGIGTLCPNCRHPVRECVCPKGAPGVVKPGAVRVGREVKGRAGKGVTTVTGLPLSLADIEALATRLKKRCGSGGTVREGIIEIQGDHRDVIVAELVKAGFAAKKSGG